LKVDLYGTALVLEEFGNVIARGGSGIVIASMSGHRLPALSAEQNAALATTPVEELLKLPMLQLDKVTDPLNAYQISKRGNSLRVMAEAVRWGKRGARVNTINPGIIITALANDELKGPRGAGYRNMIEACAAGRAGTPDEVGTVGALLTAGGRSEKGRTAPLHIATQRTALEGDSKSIPLPRPPPLSPGWKDPPA
jgi:NAD(P)-dependent dehydrogenase (short-subunit alcohol dehydrogenase family)